MSKKSPPLEPPKRLPDAQTSAISEHWFEQKKGNELGKFVEVVQGIRTAMTKSKLSKAVLIFEGEVLKLYERKGSWFADLLARW